MLSLIAAIGQNRELGKNNGLLWRLPEDMKRFKDLTTGHPVIMGRKTFESIPAKYRPLPNRANIIISQSLDSKTPDIYIKPNLDKAINEAKKHEGSDEIFIIGGGQVYAQALSLADRLYLTVIDQAYPDADTFFPDYKNIFSRQISADQQKSEVLTFTFLTLEK